MATTLKIVRLKGLQAKPYILDLAALRIAVFRSFPYLYDGDIAYEKKYLQRYTDSPHANLILVFDGDKVVGASTGMPLGEEADYVKAAFQNTNLDLQTVFYFGESVLQAEYRGQEIGKVFFAEREAAARELGCTITSFCAVERPANHPRQPADWHSLESFWKKLGYEKHPDIQTTYSWKDLDEEMESPKLMTFWIKQL